jgi:hypothetical protein
MVEGLCPELGAEPLDQLPDQSFQYILCFGD